MVKHTDKRVSSNAEAGKSENKAEAAEDGAEARTIAKHGIKDGMYQPAPPGLGWVLRGDFVGTPLTPGATDVPAGVYTGTGVQTAPHGGPTLATMQRFKMYIYQSNANDQHWACVWQLLRIPMPGGGFPAGAVGTHTAFTVYFTSGSYPGHMTPDEFQPGLFPESVLMHVGAAGAFKEIGEALSKEEEDYDKEHADRHGVDDPGRFTIALGTMNFAMDGLNAGRLERALFTGPIGVPP